MKSLRLLGIVLLGLMLSTACTEHDDEVLQTIGTVEFTKVELDTIAEKVGTSTVNFASKVNVRPE